MKKIISVILVLIFATVPAFAFEGEALIHSVTQNVYIEGRLEAAPAMNAVTVCIEDSQGELAYINDFPINSAGVYRCKFKFEALENIAAYTVRVNVGGADATETVLLAEATPELQVLELSILNEDGKKFISQQEVVKAAVKVANVFADASEVPVFVAYYDEEYKLLGLETSRISIGYEVDTIFEGLEISAPDAVYAKAFLWGGSYSMFPQTKPSKIEKQVFAKDILSDKSNDITVSYLGGSITLGNNNGWAKTLTDSFFGGDNGYASAACYNVGIGGTSSLQGLYRLKRDVISVEPDVVFIEFTVNDSGHDDAIVKERVEAMVRQLISLPKQPVIIFIYPLTVPSEDVWRNVKIPVYNEVAQAYGIAAVDLLAAMTEFAANEGITWTEFRNTYFSATDGTHPSKTGYNKYAEFIIKAIEEESMLDASYTMPEEPIFGREFINPDLISCRSSRAVYSEGWDHVAEVKNDSGSFNLGDLTLKDYKQFNWPGGLFGDGVMQAEGGGQSVTFSFSGNAIGIYALRGRDGNIARYSIDNGRYTGTIKTYYDDSDRPVVVFERHDLPDGEHTITITTQEPTAETGSKFRIAYFLTDEPVI